MSADAVHLWSAVWHREDGLRNWPWAKVCGPPCHELLLRRRAARVIVGMAMDKAGHSHVQLSLGERESKGGWADDEEDEGEDEGEDEDEHSYGDEDEEEDFY